MRLRSLRCLALPEHKLSGLENKGSAQRYSENCGFHCFKIDKGNSSLLQVPSCKDSIHLLGLIKVGKKYQKVFKVHIHVDVYV